MLIFSQVANEFLHPMDVASYVCNCIYDYTSISVNFVLASYCSSFSWPYHFFTTMVFLVPNILGKSLAVAALVAILLKLDIVKTVAAQ